MNNTYTIKKNFTALDFEEGNLVYDATHDAMLKVAYIGKRRVQLKTILQIIFEDTANGMLIKVEALDEKGTLPKDNRGRKQFKHLIKIRVSNSVSRPYWTWTYPQWGQRDSTSPYQPYPWYNWSTTQTEDGLSLSSGVESISGTINNTDNITSIGSGNVLRVKGNNSIWATSASTSLGDNISYTTTSVNKDQIQQDQTTTAAFWNMFGLGYDEEKEEYNGKF